MARALRLCNLRPRDVHQPTRSRLSHAKKSKRRLNRPSMCSSVSFCIRCPSSPVALHPHKLKDSFPPHGHVKDSSRFHYQSYPSIKERLRNSCKSNCHVMVRLPSVQVRIPRHRRSANTFDGYDDDNVVTYMRLHSSSSWFDSDVPKLSTKHDLTHPYSDHQEPVLPFSDTFSTKATKPKSRPMRKAGAKSLDAYVHSIEAPRRSSEVATKFSGEIVRSLNEPTTSNSDHIFYQKPLRGPKRSTKSELKPHMESQDDAITIPIFKSLLPHNDRSGLRESQSCHEFTRQLEALNMEELQDIAVSKSVETTQGIKNCLRLAEDMRNEAEESLNVLHQQGEQAQRAHRYTLEIDENLSVGEKVLESFGGIFFKPWRPVTTLPIKGPDDVNQNYCARRKKSRCDQLNPRKEVRIDRRSRCHLDSLAQAQVPWQAKVEVAKREQDEALTDLGNVVSELKRMSLDMGMEISRQTEALDPFQEEVTELSQRLRRANLRGRFLLAR